MLASEITPLSSLSFIFHLLDYFLCPLHLISIIHWIVLFSSFLFVNFLFSLTIFYINIIPNDFYQSANDIIFQSHTACIPR